MNESDILTQVLKEVFSSKKLAELKAQMDKINPERMCLLCRAECEQGYLLCLQCYIRESLKLEM